MSWKILGWVEKEVCVERCTCVQLLTHLTLDIPCHKRLYSIPCQSHHSRQVLTCHRLGCDLDVTQLPGIVLSQRGSSQQDALKILLSDILAESGLIVCYCWQFCQFICMVFPLCTCNSCRPKSGVTWRLLCIAGGTCAWQANVSSYDPLHCH